MVLVMIEPTLKKSFRRGRDRRPGSRRARRRRRRRRPSRGGGVRSCCRVRTKEKIKRDDADRRRHERSATLIYIYTIRMATEKKRAQR